MIEFFKVHDLEIKDFTLIVSNFTVIVGLAVFWFATYQFKINQIWKSNEFIAKEMHDFISDANTREVINILDYKKKKFSGKIGNHDVTIITYHQSGDMPAAHDGNYHVSLSIAFDPRPRQDIPPAEELVRDKFDLYFNSIERFAVFAKSNLYSKKQLYGFIKYHIDILNDLKGHSFGYHESLYKYLTWYNFDLAVGLLRSYERSERAEVYWQDALQAATSNEQAPLVRIGYLERDADQIS